MIDMAKYEVKLSVDGQLIGDVRDIAQGLNWVKSRTSYGVDEINFTLNDRVFQDWCVARGTDISNVLRPFALDAKIVRNGVELVGGYLATMPAYQAQNASASLQMHFDGYLNLLNGVYLRPTATVTKEAGLMVKDWIDFAESRATWAGKPFGITAGNIDTLAVIQRTFDNYKPVKEAITDLCDNIEGAGPFDVIFNPDRSYYITNQLGRDITEWKLYYPTRLTGKSIATISAPEVQGFASYVIALGAGETSSNPEMDTASTSEAWSQYPVLQYGYVEKLVQYSSISNNDTLSKRAYTDFVKASEGRWTPEITLLGLQVPPEPDSNEGLWIGDYVTIENTADPTGQTSGRFRVNKLTVDVSANGGEVVKPELERAS